MALAQLQQLESIFIASGWLSRKCNAFNLEYADAIREGTKFPQAANLYAMNTFVVTPMSQPGKCDARDQDSAKVVPEANEKMSFSEVVNPYGLIVHCFVSHFWGHLFSQTVTALRRWAEMNCERIGAESPRIGVESPKSMVFWICLFALNQHAVADEVGENPRQGPFNAALAQAEGGAVMVLDEEINPFKRIWCLFEISRLKELNRPFELICDMGSLSKPESLAVQHDSAAAARLLQATCQALWEVSAIKAKASVKEDQLRIWEEIANPNQRKILKKAQLIGVEEKMFSQFDQFSQALLSSALLQFCLMQKHFAAAATCCEKGACFTREQFAQIYTHVREEDRKSWLSKLLIFNTNQNRVEIVGLLLQFGPCMEDAQYSLLLAARDGFETVTKLLLDYDADVDGADNIGRTALIYAAEGGHETVIKLLLDYDADVAAAVTNGRTALISAVQGGHETVTKLLLDYGAYVEAAVTNGRTALSYAALRDHETVTKLLLDYGADMAAADVDGVTALMVAVQRGYVEVTRLLLDYGADVAAADINGVTALIYAAQCGHEIVTKLLLLYRADVAAADINGRTALMVAAQRDHETVTRLLLDYGADVAAADINQWSDCADLCPPWRQ